MASCDQPIMWQLEEMMEFCCRHKNLYIWGAAHDQQMLRKYLGICGIEVEGFIESKDHHRSWDGVYTIGSVAGKAGCIADVGILVATADDFFNRVIQEMTEYGFSAENFYLLSSYNKRTISHKMTPRPRERMWIEVNLADHCNLNCQMCDHFSQLANPAFLDLNSYRRDIERLAELSGGHIDIMKLQGGEPLLNEDLIEFIKVTRKAFPKAIIFFFTNGLLLKSWENHKRGNLWQICHDYDVKIELTVYPINLKIEEIRQMAERYDVCLHEFSEVGDRNFPGVKHSQKHPFDLEGKVEKWQFISCYQFNECIVLRQGKLYTCPIIPYIHHFNTYFGEKLEISKQDYIDIHQAQSYEELAEFVTKRPEFCKYCKVRNRRAFEWKQSVYTIEEYVDLDKEAVSDGI